MTDLALLKVKGLNLRPLIFSLESLSSADLIHIIKHSAVLGTGDMGSVLLNDCGELLGFNMSLGYSSGNSLKTASQNVRVTSASASCVAPVRQAKERAQRSHEVAVQAKLEATEAQRVAKSMEVKLLATDRKMNNSLSRQARLESLQWRPSRQ